MQTSTTDVLGPHHERLHADARLRSNARGRDGGVREELAAGMNKKRRTYQPRIVGGQVICRSKAPSLERMGPVFDREDLTLLDHHFMSGVAQPAFMSTRANSR
jgi:hypothetical protein